MGIKYHDNMNPPMYGPDNMLSDNWNPDADYGNEYVDVHFRIEAPAYYRGPGLGFKPEERERFYQEAKAVFRSLGWLPEKPHLSGVCLTVCCGKASLYLHPQDFSGEIPKNSVKTVAEALERHETFFLRWVDLYETAYDMSDEAYHAYLCRQTERIRAEILAESKTPRRSLYFPSYSVACAVAKKVKLRRVGEEDGRYSGGAGKTANFVAGMIPQLIDEGYLVAVVADDGSQLIRTITKTEQRQRKLKIA